MRRKPVVRNICIKSSKTADLGDYDQTKVTEQQVKLSAEQHISDVRSALSLFASLIAQAQNNHDVDKLRCSGQFYRELKSGFETTDWWDSHKKVTRHHLAEEDGVPDDVNLIDVIEYIADCVTAGLARTGAVYRVSIPNSLLQQAFNNTVDMLLENIAICNH